MLTLKPVTLDTRDDFIALFEARGAPKFCWCMVWRATAEEGRGTSGEVRRGQMLGRVDAGVPVGLIGYVDGKPQAWVSIAPRETYRRLKGPDDVPEKRIWSLACMYVPRKLRKQGLSRELILGAVEHARAQGAEIVEAYPVAPDAPSYRFMGIIPAFEALGFSPAGMAGKRRHVMRLDLTQ